MSSILELKRDLSRSIGAAAAAENLDFYQDLFDGLFLQLLKTFFRRKRKKIFQIFVALLSGQRRIYRKTHFYITKNKVSEDLNLTRNETKYTCTILTLLNLTSQRR